MKILMRNLNRKVSEDALAAMFKPFWVVQSCNLVLDKVTGLSKGFGFVEMLDEKEAQEAIRKLNGQGIEGVKMRVKRTLRGEPHIPYQEKKRPPQSSFEPQESLK